MTEKGYKGGLVSRVKNKYSGKKYIISTAQEIGKDYWTTVLAPSKFFGLWMDFSKRLTWVRNNKEQAHRLHWELKNVVENSSEQEWLTSAPRPRPPEGYSKNARETIKKRVGVDPGETSGKDLWEADESFKETVRHYTGEDKN